MGTNNQLSVSLEYVYSFIRDNGFSEPTLRLMDNYISNILNGKTNLTQFNQSEHAVLCLADEMLIGAYIVCNYARASLEAGADAATGKGGPANWEIDALQEKFVQQWAEVKHCWFPNAEQDIESEIDAIVATKGFTDNHEGQEANYINEHLHLENMHPANVFIDTISNTPICIDCIVEFNRP